jgi:tetratricopeptide (TPR) repeat protein
MVRRICGRPIWLSLFVLVTALAVAMPAFAQSTGIIKGTVTDEKGQAIPDAKVTLTMVGGSGRKFETKSDKKGEFLQVGLGSGSYDVAAEKDKLGSAPVTVAVRANVTQTTKLVLGVASAAAAKEAAEKGAALKKAFDEGVAASSAGKHQEAIEKFQAGIQMSATCYDCYNNIGFSYTQLKDYDKAEAAYKKSIELKSTDATAYNGLATVYNAQRKFDLAAEASKKGLEYGGGGAAGGGGNADALYNQAVILFNQGKPAEAKPLLEQAVAAKPDMADAHYLLGMTLVGIDPPKAVPEFEAYLKLAPSAPADKAKMANDIIAAFKK